MPHPTIIVHGGAGAIQPHIWEEFKQGAHEAAGLGQARLDAGQSALDAALAATVFMEDHPTFNAGRGSCLNLDGVVECDAFVMTDELHIGAVAAVSGVRNPVLLARAVMEHTSHYLLAGAGALRFAREQGLELCDPAELVVPRRKLRYDEMLAKGISFDQGLDPEEARDRPGSPEQGDERTDTVGACALDGEGRMAVASSTGGIMLKLPGRVGDTPVIGGGNFCGPAGAAACTGHGEAAMRICLAKFAYDRLEEGAAPLEAAQLAVAQVVSRVQGRVGLIVLDRYGNRGWATSTQRIAVGVPEWVVDANTGAMPAGKE